MPPTDQALANEQENQKKNSVPLSSMHLLESGAFPVGSKEQLRALLQIVKSVRRGDFSVRLPLGGDGIISEIGEVLNDIIELNENMANEFGRVSKKEK